MITALLLVSILLQVIAASLAIRLIAVTGRRLGWIAISAAMGFMALRRSVTLFQQAGGGAGITADPAAELIALASSALMVAGLWWIGPMFQTIRDSEQRIRKSHRALKALSQCNEAVIHASSETELLDDVCRIVVETAGYRLAWVGIGEQDEHKSVRPVAQYGFERGYLETVQITWADDELGRGPTGTAIRTGEPSITRHILTDPSFEPWRSAAIERGYASSIALPLIMNGNERGALNIYATEPEAFDEHEVKLLREMAADLAFGVAALRTRKERNQIQEQYQGLLESAPDAIVGTDGSGNIVLANDRTCEVFGYSSEELIGKPVEILVPERFRDMHIKHRSEYYADPRTRAMGLGLELCGRRKDGTEFPVDISLSHQQFRGAPLVTSIIRDVTERKQAEEALVRSEARLREAERVARLGHWELDLRKNVLFWSDEIYRIFEIAPSHFGASLEAFLDTVHPEDREYVEKAYGESVANKTPYSIDHRILLRDGRVKFVQEQCETFYDDEGAPLRSLGTVQDITERVRAELQLQQILDAVPEGLVALDSEMNVVLANPSGHEYLALLADGREGQSLTHLGDRPVSELLPLWSRRLAVDINLQGRSPRVFEVHANPGKTAKQEGGWTLLIREVTDAREAQRRVELQDRLAAVGQLAAGIAHDFNNITGTILLMSSAMIGAGNLTEKDRERATTVGEQAKRATSLTQQILDFSRRTVMQPQPMDLVSFLKEFEKLMSRTLPENIRMTFPAAMEELVVSGDPGRLQQVLMNLALNARDAMVEGGELSFELDTIRLKPGERPPYRDMHAGEWVRLRISDSGTGIAPDVLAHVFEPFFTTKEPGHGTGLGLAQVYGIVKQHGGYIDVESRVGEGSTFVIYLPALKEGARAIAPATEAAEEKGKGETILVVEDEPALLEAIVTALEGLGYHLLTAADGREALAVYEEHAKSIDLVVSDLVMPVMGGKELYRTLRENYPDLKMVLMTGYPLGKGTRELLDQQRVTWVQKPLDIAKLSQVVRSQLKR